MRLEGLAITHLCTALRMLDCKTLPFTTLHDPTPQDLTLLLMLDPHGADRCGCRAYTGHRKPAGYGAPGIPKRVSTPNCCRNLTISVLTWIFMARDYAHSPPAYRPAGAGRPALRVGAASAATQGGWGGGSGCRPRTVPLVAKLCFVTVQVEALLREGLAASAEGQALGRSTAIPQTGVGVRSSHTPGSRVPRSRASKALVTKLGLSSPGG